MEKYYVRKDGKLLKKDVGWTGTTGMLNHISWVKDACAATVFYLAANARIWAKRTGGEVVEVSEK